MEVACPDFCQVEEKEVDVEKEEDVVEGGADPGRNHQHLLDADEGVHGHPRRGVMAIMSMDESHLDGGNEETSLQCSSGLRLRQNPYDAWHPGEMVVSLSMTDFLERCRCPWTR